MEKALEKDSEDFLDSTKACWQGIWEQVFRTDTQEHGCFGYKGADFTQNFTAPFILECGLPTTREVLEKYLEEETLHSSEHEYVEAYIQESFDGPKPLIKICRNVLRKHFQGLKIHKYLDVSQCPQKIKDFILMKHLLH